ncbi:MAG: DUF1343 domain-containing protein, partial [Bacteroidetes bacterium]
FQVHITDRHTFQPWRTGQVLLQILVHTLGDQFSWRQPPFEYEATLMPIDILNGTALLRQWVEADGTPEALNEIEMAGREIFYEQRKQALLY